MDRKELLEKEIKDLEELYSILSECATKDVAAGRTFKDSAALYLMPRVKRKLDVLGLQKEALNNE